MAKKFFTFKKEPRETGLMSVGHPHQTVCVKHDKKECGVIAPPSWNSKDNKWDVRLKVKQEPTAKDHCSWKWIYIKERFDDEQSARDWLNANVEKITNSFELFLTDPDD
jgi:hypothetical protein